MIFSLWVGGVLCPDASVFVPGLSGSSFCVRRHTSAWQSAASAAVSVVSSGGWGVWEEWMEVCRQAGWGRGRGEEEGAARGRGPASNPPAHSTEGFS